MKGPSRSTKLLLRNLPAQPKPSGPIARLASIFNHPILTDSESKILLNEINSSFRNALKESRHPDDIRPPPSIHNAYANKADNHIFQVVTDRPASPPLVGNLRDLLSSEELSNEYEIDNNSPINIFVTHLLQGTADLPLAAECCKQLVLQLKKSDDINSLDRNGGLRLHRKIYGNPLFYNKDGTPKVPLRGWLAASMFFSKRPSLPFSWLTEYLEREDYTSFRTLLSEIITSYGKIYNTPESPNENVKLFIHILKARDDSYRHRVSEHPSTLPITRAILPVFTELSTAIRESGDKMVLLTPVAYKLYKKGNNEAKKMIADTLDLWDTQRSPVGAEILIDQGDFLGAAEYLVNHPGKAGSKDLSLGVVVGLMITRKLRDMRGEKALTDRVMETVEDSIQRLLGGSKKPSETSLSESILSTWKSLRGSGLDNDLALASELQDIEKRVREDLGLAVAPALVR
ncbi:hypothetical protein TWF730_010275 [Orbilia blumenaviensis]|uniref:Uncharacterized protein n=1 Tax=Orbilia blumenaviensis TaxID=1796055 RepID=A0AAV9UU24_9PEZI